MSETPSIDPARRLAIIIVLVAANMLALAATDLYLPSVPYLPEVFGSGIEEVQFTLATFSAGFAVSQILFGALGDLYNRRWVLVGSLLLFVPASLWCALSTSVESLIVARFAQGFSASASAALTAPMLRPLFDEARAVHAISVIGGIDAVIPAFAPILGAWIFAQFGWEANFWIIVILGAPLTVAALILIPDDRPETHHTSIWPVLWGFTELLRHRRFMGYALSHGFSLGGLLVLVFSAPYLIVAHMEGGPAEYIYSQILWVGLFLLAANLTGFAMRRISADQLIWLGNGLQITSATALVAYAILGGGDNWLIMAVLGIPYAMGLGLRGGAGFARAIDAVPSHGARASALIIFFAIGLAGASTALVAPYLDLGLISAAAAMLGMSLTALALLTLIRSKN
jgi:Bcr/CflA subfamily drug resistance transporter